MEVADWAISTVSEKKAGSNSTTQVSIKILYFDSHKTYKQQGTAVEQNIF